MRYCAEGTETGVAFWIVDTATNVSIGLLDRTNREALNLVIDALNRTEKCLRKSHDSKKMIEK